MTHTPDARGPAAETPMFTRSELLGGLPARRASTALFAIESTTARLAAASRINRARYAGERTGAEREQQFLQAIASGGDLPRHVAIVDIERFAPDWAGLVPPDPDARAAVAHLLGGKYRFRERDVPQLRAALGLDDPAVGSAHRRLYGAPLGTVYADALPMADRLRWRLSAIGARFDRLPPFWIAFFIALTETLGEGIMSVPLALAGLGPLPGVVLLLLLGLVNLTTVAAFTESVTRSGSMRYGTAYFGRLVRELLGGLPSSAMSVALAFFNILTFFVYLLGFASVLTGATGIPLGAWIALLFVINVVVLRKETLDDTIASATVIGTVNLLLVVAITAIAALHVDPRNLAYANVPLLNGQPIDGPLVGLVFGVVLVAFFAHTAPANAAKMVLTLDPSGRSLLWGNVASLATVIVLYCFASFAILGVLGPAPLLGTKGTAITPLGDAVGPIIHVLGSAYVVLAIGIGSLYVGLGLYNQVIELLPRPSAARGEAGLLARLAATRRGRLAVGLAPATAVFLALEVIVLTGQDSFAGPIALGGVLAVPVITGIFPLLLVVAARRKGEYVPGSVVRIVGHPALVIALLVVFVVAVAAHGLVIWDGPVERIAALAMTAVSVALIAWVWRGGVGLRRAIVEVRRDRRRERTTISVTGAGQAIVAEVPVDGPASSLATADVPAGRWRELRVWPHEVMRDGWSVPLPAELELESDGETIRRSIAPSPDPVVVEFDGRAAIVRIRLGEAPGA
jgi:hypothetical protein